MFWGEAVYVEIVIKWLLTPGSILELEMRRCVLRNHHMLWGEAVYLLWGPNLPKDLQTQNATKCSALVWLDKRSAWFIYERTP